MRDEYSPTNRVQDPDTVSYFSSAVCLGYILNLSLIAIFLSFGGEFFIVILLDL